MAFPFSKCPHISGFTYQTGAKILQEGIQHVTQEHDTLIYHESAEVDYTVGEIVLRAGAGSVLILPKNLSTSAHIQKSGSVICIGYSILENEPKSNLALITTTVPSRLRNRFLHFASLSSMAPTVSTECAMLAEFYGILYDLQRNTADGNRQTLLEEKIRPSISYLENHLTDRRLDMKKISALSGVSEAYFRRLFSQQYGCTPLQFVIEKRIRMAEKMLKETDLPLRTIEQSCGFQSHAYFLKQFQRITGRTLEEMR